MSDDRMHRVLLGQPETLGEFRRMTVAFSDEMKLAVRNAPLPTLYYLMCDGAGFLEVNIPDITGRKPGSWCATGRVSGRGGDDGTTKELH